MTVPDLERAEIREIYSKKGFSGDLLDRIVETITRDKDVWVSVMLSEEHGLSAVDRRASLRASLVVGVSSTLGSIVPLAPFAFAGTRTATWLSVVVSALTLFALGAYKARVTVGSISRSGLELATIGTLSALVGYLIGLLLQTPVH
jgi:vacuolar iron transporter family protein